MFTRFTDSKIYQSISSVTNNTFNQIFKMIRFNTTELFSEAYDLAKSDELGSALISIGPGIFSKRYAIFVGAKDPKVTAQQLQAITDIDQAEARQFFNPIADLTDSNFFLAFGRTESIGFRKSFYQYANMEIAQSEAAIMVDQLIKTLQETSTFTENPRYTAYMNAGSIVSKILFGFEYTPELDNLMTDLENATMRYHNSFLKSYAYSEQSIIKYEIRERTDAFLLKYITEARQKLVRAQEEKGSLPTPDNLLEHFLIAHIIKNYGGDARLANPGRLIFDANLRLAISGLLATRNIGKLIQSALDRFYDNDVDKRFLDLLVSECLEDQNYSDKAKHPLLTAFYLECLRYSPPTAYIIRHVPNETTIGDLIIPANTTIVFDLQKSLKRLFDYNEKSNETKFNPRHYLKQDDNGEYSLDLEKEKKSSGMNLAFGIGARSCPGFKVTEKAFLIYVGHVIRRVEELNTMSVKIRLTKENFDAEKEKFDAFIKVKATEEISSWLDQAVKNKNYTLLRYAFDKGIEKYQRMFILRHAHLMYREDREHIRKVLNDNHWNYYKKWFDGVISHIDLFKTTTVSIINTAQPLINQLEDGEIKKRLTALIQQHQARIEQFTELKIRIDKGIWLLHIPGIEKFLNEYASYLMSLINTIDIAITHKREKPDDPKEREAILRIISAIGNAINTISINCVPAGISAAKDYDAILLSTIYIPNLIRYYDKKKKEASQEPSSVSSPRQDHSLFKDQPSHSPVSETEQQPTSELHTPKND